MGRKLRDLAREMDVEASRRGQCVRELSGGMRVELGEEEGLRWLRLSRPAVEVEQPEIELFVDVFGVPCGALLEVDGTEAVLTWEI